MLSVHNVWKLSWNYFKLFNYSSKKYLNFLPYVAWQANGFDGTLILLVWTLFLLHMWSQWPATGRNISWFMALSIRVIRDCGRWWSNLLPQDYEHDVDNTSRISVYLCNNSTNIFGGDKGCILVYFNCVSFKKVKY